ncbi:hypothetical protein BN3659_01315 [Alistipes sp. CHKCI003]|nr:hypothetical protein BN3659_01315 [Alistipes sp. CHKCI003]
MNRADDAEHSRLHRRGGTTGDETGEPDSTRTSESDARAGSVVSEPRTGRLCAPDDRAAVRIGFPPPGGGVAAETVPLSRHKDLRS